MIVLVLMFFASIADSQRDVEESMTPAEMIRYWGYPVESYDVITDDGYVLSLLRIPYGRSSRGNDSCHRPPILLAHGLLADSTEFVEHLPESSPGMILADAGFDVFMLNHRGTTHSQRHLRLSTSDPEFWKYSLDDMAKYDAPAAIDKALKINGASSLYWIGHSQGTIVGFLLLAERPEYNQKVRAVFQLAPVGSLHFAGTFGRLLMWVAATLRPYLITPREVGFHNPPLVGGAMRLLCASETFGEVCKALLRFVAGPPAKSGNWTRFPLFMSHFFVSTSSWTLLQLAEITAPSYNYTKIESDMYLFWSRNDWLTTPEEVEWLLPQLRPGIVKAFEVSEYNHLDYSGATDIGERVFSKIIKIVRVYEGNILTRMRVLTAFLSCVALVHSYKILMYNSQYGHSHSTFMGRIADVLVDAGHNVTSLIPEIDPISVGHKSKSNEIRIAQGAAAADFMKSYSDQKQDMFSVNVFNPIGSLFLNYFFSKLFSTQCRTVLEQDELIEKLRAEHYDVMITENVDFCGTALTELIQPKSFILTSSSMVVGGQHEEFGVPTALSYNPEPFVSRMNVHSMWDRLVNIYANSLVRISFGGARSSIDAVFKEKFGPSFPSVLEISAKSAYVFVNSEPLIDFAAPTISKVINIGGIGVKQPKKLIEDWEAILAKREKTVLLSFGSMTKSAYLSQPIKMSIIETVKALPHVTFIWKYEEDDDFTREIASKIPNLELTKWMPQVDLLAHPKLSAFITHGGMGSTQETAWRGTPGIFVPLFGDQPRNAAMMEHNGIGQVLNKHDFADPAKFTAVVREVIENDRRVEGSVMNPYRINARRVSDMLHKKPFSVRDLIVKYTEFAAEFGPSTSLRPQSYDMSWIEYHNVDLIIAGILVALITIAISAKIIQQIVKRFCEIAKSKKD